MMIYESVVNETDRADIFRDQLFNLFQGSVDTTVNTIRSIVCFTNPAKVKNNIYFIYFTRNAQLTIIHFPRGHLLCKEYFIKINKYSTNIDTSNRF